MCFICVYPWKTLRHHNYCRTRSTAAQGLLSRLFNDIHTVICCDCLQISECTARFCLVGIQSCKSHRTWEKAQPPCLSSHQDLSGMYLLNVSRWLYLGIQTQIWNSPLCNLSSKKDSRLAYTGICKQAIKLIARFLCKTLAKFPFCFCSTHNSGFSAFCLQAQTPGN